MKTCSYITAETGEGVPPHLE